MHKPATHQQKTQQEPEAHSFFSRNRNVRTETISRNILIFNLQLNWEFAFATIENARFSCSIESAMGQFVTFGLAALKLSKFFFI